jgi:hypothetical protein
MESYERKMNLIKSGAQALEDIKGYDPLQDLQSHSKSMKRTPAQSERCVSCIRREAITNILSASYPKRRWRNSAMFNGSVNRYEHCVFTNYHSV